MLVLIGKINFSCNEIVSICGYLFSIKSDIFLYYGLLDILEFFWEYLEYELVYNVIVKYLDICFCVEFLLNKLNVIYELFEMLVDELKYKYFFFLEWIIIILIVFEIVMFGV